MPSVNRAAVCLPHLAQTALTIDLKSQRLHRYRHLPPLQDPYSQACLPHPNPQLTRQPQATLVSSLSSISPRSTFQLSAPHSSMNVT